jgi:3(or 17)beta-hydroxysteroid dehydrogenase
MGGRVKDKVAIVTGAASGVGREDALLLAREGARVVLTDVNEDGGAAVAREIGDGALFVRHDIAREDDWRNVIALAQQRFGPPDILVNNAAILLMAGILETTLEQWERVLRINAGGYFLGCKHGLAAMRERGGSIINMSSTAALGGLPPFCAYSASKGAVTALTRNVASWCRVNQVKVRCNSIHPDAIATPMLASVEMPADLPPERLVEMAARTCQPRDVANLVLFLASDESRHINGAELRIDNAQTIMGIA